MQMCSLSVYFPSTKANEVGENWAWRSDRCLCLSSRVIPFDLPFTFSQNNKCIVFT